MGSPSPPADRLEIGPSRPVTDARAPVRRLRVVAAVAVVSWMACSLVPTSGSAFGWPFWLVRAWFALCLCAPPLFFGWARPADGARRAWLAWLLGGLFVTAMLVRLEPEMNHDWWQGSIPETAGEYPVRIAIWTLFVTPFGAAVWWVVSRTSQGMGSRSA